MLSYRLPSFLDYLSHHDHSLYAHDSGRLTEPFPSSAGDKDNPMIVPDTAGSCPDDERVLQLWKEFQARQNRLGGLK